MSQSPDAPPKADRPNILLITTDQQRFDTIHCAGNPSILTPHLDWMCDTGIRYCRAYSDCPVCGPARASIMTGLYAWNHSRERNTQQPLAGRPTLPGMLTAGGYQTRAIGKMHFNPMRCHYGFEHMELTPDFFRWIARQPGIDPPKDHGVAENEMDPVFATTSERFTNTHWVVDRSIDFIETRDDTRPFFLWASFAKPHPPFDPLKKYWDLYDGIPLPEAKIGDWSARFDQIHPLYRRVNYQLNSADRLSPQRLRNVIRAYYACITQIDYNLGLLFARLRETGLLNNTWIIFTSDHGEMLGDHHMGSKCVYFEGSAHIPLLIRPPSGYPPEWLWAHGGSTDPRGGSVVDRLVCLADILPTCLSIAGLPNAAGECDGLDLTASRQREVLVGRCTDVCAAVARDGWKLHCAADGSAELLFDTAADPYEQHNLIAAADPRIRARAQSLREQLRPVIANTGWTIEPRLSEIEYRRTVCTGYSSRSDPQCDLLH